LRDHVLAAWTLYDQPPQTMFMASASPRSAIMLYLISKKLADENDSHLCETSRHDIESTDRYDEKSTNLLPGVAAIPHPWRLKVSPQRAVEESHG
jgi:hypothetical protein